MVFAIHDLHIWTICSLARMKMHLFLKLEFLSFELNETYYVYKFPSIFVLLDAFPVGSD